MSGNSMAARVIEVAPTAFPASFDGDATLFGFNLFLMTAMFFLGLMMAGKQARRIWTQRLIDHPLHPVSLYRTKLMFAAAGVALWCGAEALMLWGWDPRNPVMTARVVMAKRWIDPAAALCGMLWMSITILGEAGMEWQLRKAPLPTDMWSRWPALMRALGVIGISFVMALAAVTLR